jgi:hypothetical protein
MDYSIFDFTKRYCFLYEIKEDDLTAEDVQFIEDTFFEYNDHGNLPSFMRLHEV